MKNSNRKRNKKKKKKKNPKQWGPPDFAFGPRFLFLRCAGPVWDFLGVLVGLRASVDLLALG